MTLKEIAQEYRRTAARLAMAIAAHEKKGDVPEHEIALMRVMLRDTRTALRAVSSYYDLPRTGELDSSSWTAGGYRHDDS